MAESSSKFTGTEIKAGIMVLASLAVFCGFVAAIYGFRGVEPTNTFHVFFTDTLGLNEGAEVRYGGAKVGRVARIGLDPENQTRIRVDFEVRPGTPVNTKSVGYVTQTTLTAEKHLEVSTGEADAKRLPQDSEIPSRTVDILTVAGDVGTKVSAVLDDVRAILAMDDYAATVEEAEAEGKERLVSVPRLLQTADGAIDDVRQVIQSNRTDIDEIVDRIQNIEESAQTLVEDLRSVVAENKPDLRASVENVRAASVDARDAVAQSQQIVEDIAQVTARLDSLAALMESVLTNTDELSGNAKAMVEDSRPELEDIVYDLRMTTQYFKEFARTISEQPQAVLRGQEPKGRLIGE